MLSGDLHLKNINYGRHNNTRDERIESEKILTITRYNKKKKKKTHDIHSTRSTVRTRTLSLKQPNSEHTKCIFQALSIQGYPGLSQRHAVTLQKLSYFIVHDLYPSRLVAAACAQFLQYIPWNLVGFAPHILVVSPPHVQQP